MNNIQKCILSIFKEVSQICSNNKIPYYAIGGTCLGAVRHKGFIPWDDDLDIAIPIEYYDSFLRSIRKSLSAKYYILTPSDSQHYHSLWVKVCDSRTAFIEKSEYKYPDSYKGVFIDIMPISGIPKTRLRRKIFCLLLIFLDRSNNILRFCRDAKKSKRYTIYLPYLILSYIIPYNFFSNVYYKLLKTQPLYDSIITGYVWYTCWLNRLIFPTSWFKNAIDIPFENTTISCPKEYHDYLTLQFGDYMTPPPVNKRQTHSGIINLNKSFIDYQRSGIHE